MSSPLWYKVWSDAFSLSGGFTETGLAALVLLFTYLLVIIPSSALMSYLDRKLAADFQARIGPNRAGPAGILQPLADLLKLLQKESTPSALGSRVKTSQAMWFVFHTMALFATVAVLPLCSGGLLVDTDLSAFLPFWSALVLALGVMFLGFSQGTVPGWFGGVRVAAQTLAAAFPALIALLCAGLHAGAFRWSSVAAAQGASPLSWTAFSQPFQFLAFVIFMVSGLCLLGIAPMDGAYQAPDLNGGVAAHLSGYRLVLFRFGRFYGFFLWSVITVVLFLGAWNLPGALTEYLRDSQSYLWIQTFELICVLLKSFMLMVLVIWVSRVNPRVRVDQVTDLSWRILGPGALTALIGSALWSFFLGKGIFG